MKINLRTNRENTIYTIILIVIVGLFIIFFTSKEWLYDDTPIRQTPYNETITKLSQTDIEIEDWEYNKIDNFMEIQIRKEQSGGDYIPPELEVQAYNFEDKEKIKTDIAYETDDMMLIRLSDINDDLRFVDLKIDEFRDEEMGADEATESKNDSVDVDEINDENKEVDDEERESSVILFGDYRKINENNKLEEKNETEYKIMFVMSDIKKVSKEMKDIQDNQIPKEDKRIVELENGIEKMEKELKYTTGEEKSQLESDIKGNENKIENTLENKDNLKNQLKELQSKIDKYDEKLKDLGAI